MMSIVALTLHDFRSYERASTAFGERLTVLHGPNGAGKSNLIEAICFACTGRSPRTRNDRELIRFGAGAARVELSLRDAEGGEHAIAVGFGRLGEDGGIEKRLRFDGGAVSRVQDIPERPLVAVFVPDRLALLSGPPALRRAHADALLTALWPARASVRADYARALSQRNALLARIRAGAATERSLASWDAEVARHAIALTAARAAALAEVAGGFGERCGALGLPGRAQLDYRPALRSEDPEEVAAEMRVRLEADLQRGHTTHGPHRDDVAFVRDGRLLRTFGSQGEMRLALLALLLAERGALARVRGAPPVMLLDDALSELDADRRGLLLGDLAAAGGQSVIATTDLREAAAWPSEAGDPLMVSVAGEGAIART